MSLDAFVRAAGGLIGTARDSFGTGLTGTVALCGPGDAPDDPESASGRAAQAAHDGRATMSDQLGGLATLDSTTRAAIKQAVEAADAGRGRIDAVIGQANADIGCLAPVTNTPAGQRALIDALTRRLLDTNRTLEEGHDDAATRSANADTGVGDYNALGRFNPGNPMMPQMPQTPQIPQMPMPAMPMPQLATLATLPLSGLSQLAGTFVPHSGTTLPTSAMTGSALPVDSAAAELVVRRALAQRGLPYVWGGGGPTGPTGGGFDCSGLTQYAYAGAGIQLPRTTYDQIKLGHAVPRYAIAAGDLIFSNFSSRGPEHVQLAISPTRVIEAPSPGGHVQISAIPPGRIVVKRLVNH